MEAAAWYVVLDGKKHGPLTEADLLKLISGLDHPQNAQVWREGMAAWVASPDLPEIAKRLPPPLPRTGAHQSPTVPAPGKAGPTGTLERVTFSRAFRSRFRSTQWWAAGITILALGPGHCRKFLADRSLAGATVELVVDLGSAVILNMLVFGAIFAVVLATVDVVRRR